MMLTNTTRTLLLIATVASNAVAMNIRLFKVGERVRSHWNIKTPNGPCMSEGTALATVTKEYRYDTPLELTFGKDGHIVKLNFSTARKYIVQLNGNQVRAMDWAEWSKDDSLNKAYIRYVVFHENKNAQLQEELQTKYLKYLVKLTPLPSLIYGLKEQNYEVDPDSVYQQCRTHAKQGGIEKINREMLQEGAIGVKDLLKMIYNNLHTEQYLRLAALKEGMAVSSHFLTKEGISEEPEPGKILTKYVNGQVDILFSDGAQRRYDVYTYKVTPAP